MAKNQGPDKIYDAIQTVVALATILIAVVPLGQWLFTGDHGRVFRALFGEQTGAAAFLIPIATIVVALIVILALEPMKRKAKQLR